MTINSIPHFVIRLETFDLSCGLFWFCFACEFELFKLHCKLVQQQAAIMAAASAAGGGAYIGAAPMAIATQIPPSALNGIASPGVVPSAQGPLDSDKLFSK